MNNEGVARRNLLPAALAQCHLVKANDVFVVNVYTIRRVSDILI